MISTQEADKGFSKLAAFLPWPPSSGTLLTHHLGGSITEELGWAGRGLPASCKAPS